MGKSVEHVFYNDGINPDIYAIVIKTNADGSLNLFCMPEADTAFVANGIPRREKKDYDAAGGGRTYHEA